MKAEWVQFLAWLTTPVWVATAENESNAVVKLLDAIIFDGFN